MPLDDFTYAYIACALWADARDDDGEPCDPDPDDLAPAARAVMEADAADFYAAHASEWEDVPGYDDEQAGHDFWLTRNRHGTGFWDRPALHRAAGRRLTDAAHRHGEQDLYRGDDGQWHVA